MEENSAENSTAKEQEHLAPDIVEQESDESEEQTHTPPSPVNPLVLGSAIAIAFAVGLVLGLLGRPLLLQDVPVQVNVTVVPSDNSGEAVAQATPAGVEQASEPAAQNETATESEAEPANGEPTQTLMEFVMTDVRHIQGDEDAPVTIVEFSDFKWSFCGRFANDSLNRIRAEYIETGKVKFAYKHFAILGPESSRSAEASECAGDQDAFWPYHDLLFVDQAENYSTLNQETLVQLAGQLDLDTEAFSECLSSGQHSIQINQDTQAASALGLRGTPGFLVNGLFINGAQPFEVFQQVIEEKLAAVEQ